MPVQTAIASPTPKRGWKMKSVPIMSAAPSSVIANPRQKAVASFFFRISQVPSATQSGAVFPKRVAFEAVVYESEAVHSPRSQAVNTPASKGKIMDRDLSDEFILARGRKKGSSKKIEKKRR